MTRTIQKTEPENLSISELVRRLRQGQAELRSSIQEFRSRMNADSRFQTQRKPVVAHKRPLTMAAAG